MISPSRTVRRMPLRFLQVPPRRDGTSEIVLAGCCERAATLTTAGETCQQMLGMAVKPEFFLAGFPHSVTAPDTGESLLDAVPEIVFDDPQLGHALDNSIALWVYPG